MNKALFQLQKNANFRTVFLISKFQLKFTAFPNIYIAKLQLSAINCKTAANHCTRTAKDCSIMRKEKQRL
ncbi:MAG: hypothetical protein NC401_16425, partial [Ruminococcus sp.]|nr:hypothetical protein [Ruminococcus sp.]